MHTLRTIQLNLREGSTGIELVSAFYKILLSSTFLAGHANPNSSLFALIGDSPIGAWFLLILGVVHIGCWVRPARLPWIAIRKGCSVVGIAVWISIVYDLIDRGASATVILLAPVVLMLGVAIMRRSYTVV